MNSKDFVRIISKEYQLSQNTSNHILKTILETIVRELKKNNLVRLRNFGTFQTKKSHGKLRAKFNTSKNFFNLNQS